jgi:hypothetical protein
VNSNLYLPLPICNQVHDAKNKNDDVDSIPNFIAEFLPFSSHPGSLQKGSTNKQEGPLALVEDYPR